MVSNLPVWNLLWPALLFSKSSHVLECVQERKTIREPQRRTPAAAVCNSPTRLRRVSGVPSSVARLIIVCADADKWQRDAARGSDSSFGSAAPRYAPAVALIPVMFGPPEMFGEMAVCREGPIIAPFAAAPAERRVKTVNTKRLTKRTRRFGLVRI